MRQNIAHQPTRSLFFLLLLLSFFFKASAQQYPVQGFLTIIPPYPAQLADYANLNVDRMRLQLTLTDISVPNKRVKLKVFIQRQNSLWAQSSGNAFGEMPITLTSGIPEQLTSAELASYFKLQNLQGLTPDSYAQTMSEGMFDIYFVVYDYFTNRQLSGKIDFMFFLLLNDPPLLNTPLNGENIPNAGANNPQIVFSWMPRTTQVSNTDYVFTLAPIYDPSGDPFSQFLASIPLYQTTVSNQTNLLYGITEPPLIEGKTYAWRIQAKAKQSFEDVGLYRQNGYSEIHTFKYAGACSPIPDIDVTIDARGTDRLYVSWVPPSPAPADGYKVAYRKYTAGGTWEWQEQATTQTYANIFDLEANTQYELKVAKVCDAGLLAYSNPQKATTLSKSQVPTKIDCGKVPAIDISNQNPLAQLNAGDVVMAGDFPVTILSASGSPGTFSGEGWLKVPWLADTKIHVKYQNIKVNTDRRLIGGYFETVYNPDGKNIVSVDTLMANVQGLLSNIKDWITDTAKASKNIAIIQKTVDSLNTNNPNISDSTSAKLDQDVAAIKALPTMYASASGNDKDAVIKQAIEDADKLNKDIKEGSNQPQPTAQDQTSDELTSNESAINPDPSNTAPAGLTAFLSPAGEPIYLDRANLGPYWCNTNGTLAGFQLKTGEYYTFTDNTYINKANSNAAWSLLQKPAPGQVEVVLIKKTDGCQAQLYGVTVTYPNTNKVIPDIGGGTLKETIELQCIDKYFDKNGADFISALEKIYTIYNFFKNCSNQQWSPYDGGVIPYCFWKDSNIDPDSYYALIDRPFTSGVIDGAYGQLKGLYDIGQNFDKVVEAYSLSLLECDNLLQDNDSYQSLEKQIQDLQPKTDLWSSISRAIAEYRKNNLARHILSCLDAQGVRDAASETIDKLYTIISDQDKLDKAAAGIEKSLDTYFKQINNTDEIARYKQGKLLSDIATLFIGTGEVSGADKMVKFEEYLSSASAADIDKVGQQLIDKAGAEGLADATIFKVGDEIAGIGIKQIKAGTNGKYAIIGRSMGNSEMTGIRDVYASLKNVQKLDVEIFDASSLTGDWKIQFDDAAAEFASKTNNWTSMLSNQDLIQLKMYKLNKTWAQHLVDNGYTILDMGDFNNLGFSVFYSMEKATIFK